MGNVIKLTEFEVVSYCQIYGLLDGTRGGLLLGKRHSDGGIKGIRDGEIDEEYEAVFEAEGGEYLMNAMATEKYMQRLHEINSYKKDEDEISDERIQTISNIINNRNKDSLVYVSRYPHYIINRNATSKYLEELDMMNQKALEEYLIQHPEIE